MVEVMLLIFSSIQTNANSKLILKKIKSWKENENHALLHFFEEWHLNNVIPPKNETGNIKCKWCFTILLQFNPMLFQKSFFTKWNPEKKMKKLLYKFQSNAYSFEEWNFNKQWIKWNKEKILKMMFFNVLQFNRNLMQITL